MNKARHILRALREHPLARTAARRCPKLTTPDLHTTADDALRQARDNHAQYQRTGQAAYRKEALQGVIAAYVMLREFERREGHH